MCELICFLLSWSALEGQEWQAVTPAPLNGVGDKYGTGVIFLE